MQKSTEVGFKSLITKVEYDRLINKFSGAKTDLQTNHYFDTTRFSLKASKTSLRVRERDTLELTFKHKKGYKTNVITVNISQDEFDEILETGKIKYSEIKSQLSYLISDQKLSRYLSLKTERLYLPYKNGILFIDKSDYKFYIDNEVHSGNCDYEIEYIVQSYYQGKKEFIDIINELEIEYKKSDKKIKRAYSILKRLR